jgi:hypothetical protein
VSFFLIIAPLVRADGRVQVWATPFPTREAATAHAQRVSAPCVVIEARNLRQAIEQVRAEHAPG